MKQFRESKGTTIAVYFAVRASDCSRPQIWQYYVYDKTRIHTQRSDIYIVHVAELVPAQEKNKEIKIDIPHSLWFLKCIDGKIYGIRDEIRYSDAIHKKGFIETPNKLYEISEDFKQLKKIYDFPVQHYIKQHRWWHRATVNWTVYGHYFFMVHTAEYRIVKFDLHHAGAEDPKINGGRGSRDQRKRERARRRLLLCPPPLTRNGDLGLHHRFRSARPCKARGHHP